MPEVAVVEGADALGTTACGFGGFATGGGEDAANGAGVLAPQPMVALVQHASSHDHAPCQYNSYRPS